MKSPSQVILFLIGAIILVGIVLVRVLPRKTSHRASADAEPAVRAPAVAGTFYPGDPEALRSDVQRYLDQAEPHTSRDELVAIIVPHAGYVYSGPVAAYAYRALEGRSYDTVAVLGPSHRVPFQGVALTGADRWRTPLGSVAIDRTACDAMLEADVNARVFDAGHKAEHSIEVQLPFLQSVLDDFKLLPVLTARVSDKECAALARALAEWARGRSAVLVASTDMSHYPPYDAAVQADRETLKAIETLDADKVAATTEKLMSQSIPGLVTCLCGEEPVKTVLAAARLMGADRVEVLRYANSGDVPVGSRDRVVGYCAVAIYREAAASQETGETTEGDLNPDQQQRLLSVARAAIEEYVRAGRTLELDETDPAFLRPGAAFVTLKKNGALRGCIGSLVADRPLIRTVRDRAIDAGTRDPRFRSVAANELPHLEIEISVLSRPRKIASAEDIDITKHGVIVESGRRRGVFLPQVAEETGWSRDVLLSHLCRDKAGLPTDAWKRGATLYVFTAQAFSSPAPEEQSHGGD